MKTVNFLRILVVLLGVFLSACSGAAPVPDSSVGGGRSLASEVVFTGVIDRMDDDQWIINGRVVKVDAVVVKDGPFKVGDRIKVEARTEADGSLVALRVELPSATDLDNDNSNNANTNANLNANTNTNTNANANTNANTNANANANTNTNSNNNGNDNGNDDNDNDD